MKQERYVELVTMNKGVKRKQTRMHVKGFYATAFIVKEKQINQ